MSYQPRHTTLRYYTTGKQKKVISSGQLPLAFERIPIPNPRHHVYISGNPHGFTWDLSETIGNRPVWQSYRVGSMNHRKPATCQDTRDYTCYTPYWGSNCS